MIMIFCLAIYYGWVKTFGECRKGCPTQKFEYEIGKDQFTLLYSESFVQRLFLQSFFAPNPVFSSDSLARYSFTCPSLFGH